MISSWLASHIQAGERAFRRLLSQPLVSALSIAVIGIAIMLPLGLYVIFSNVKAATARLNTEPNINVYLQVSAKDEDTHEVEKRLRALPNAANVKFIPRESALAEMRQLTVVSDLLAGLETNPLPNAFAIQPQSPDFVLLEAMRSEISAIPKVDTVVMDFEWAQKLQRFASFAERVVGLLALVLSLAVIFVTGNTIRLQMLTQKDEIEVSLLIGATNRFVRRPFLYYGAAQGFLAGVLAILVLTVLIWWSSQEVHALTISYHSDFSLKYFTLSQMLAVVIAAITLGWIGAFVSVSLYLRQRTNR
ncbi:MAG TPA: permease-like cell division protein FtsX [Usitatibacteraceae bacterium]